MQAPDTTVTDATAADATESRREVLLEAAVAVFARYGFRKTSMDEVARAAGMSRQGLYLHFADKEELFRKAVSYKLTRQLSAAITALSDEKVSLEKRLIDACDEWCGRFVGAFGADAADLMCASTTLAGATLARYEAQFEAALAHAIGSSALAPFCKVAALEPPTVARAVLATARGLKHYSQTRQEFVQGMTAATRLFCSPIHSCISPSQG